MNKYYCIKNENGRYYGTTGQWRENFKGAYVGTILQVEHILDALRSNNSPYADKAQITKVGEGWSTWRAKLDSELNK